MHGTVEDRGICAMGKTLNNERTVRYGTKTLISKIVIYVDL